MNSNSNVHAASIVPQISRIQLAANMVYQDPIMAYHMLASLRRPRSYKAQVTFADGTSGKFKDVEFANKTNCDYIVVDMAYTIRRPLFLAGQTFKSTEDAAFMQCPYMDVFMEVAGCPQRSLTDVDQPLETVGRPVSLPRIGTVDPYPFFLPGLETLRYRVTLAKDFNAEIGEIPMTLCMVLWGYDLTCKRYAIRKWDNACGKIESEYPDFLVNYLGVSKIDRKMIDPAFLQAAAEDRELPDYEHESKHR